jgi:phage terminase large subunit-like protein
MPRRLPRKQAGAKASDAIGDALAGLSGADRVITFIERFLRHSKGFRAGEPFVLADWQRDEIVRPLYDTVTEDGRRRYRQGYLSMARKSGKTCLAAALALYHLLADEDMEPGIREVYAAAASRDQASLLFIQAADFVNGSAELSARCVVSRATKRIVDRVSRSFLRAVSADAHTQHGLNAAFVVLDEIAQQPNRDLFDVLQTSQGARRNPLLLAIGTAGHDQHSIAFELYPARQALPGSTRHGPEFFCLHRRASRRARLGRRAELDHSESWAAATSATSKSSAICATARCCCRIWRDVPEPLTNHGPRPKAPGWTWPHGTPALAR